jgi:hypothetical protein
MRPEFGDWRGYRDWERAVLRAASEKSDKETRRAEREYQAAYAIGLLRAMLAAGHITDATHPVFAPALRAVIADYDALSG